MPVIPGIVKSSFGTACVWLHEHRYSWGLCLGWAQSPQIRVKGLSHLLVIQ